MADPRLGRIAQSDPRDAKWLMARALPPTVPVGKKLWPVPYLYDQGQTPMCVGYSTSGCMTADEAQTNATVVFDAPGIYRWANANDGIAGAHDGTTVRAGFQAVMTVGNKIISTTDPADPLGSMDRLQAAYLWADTTKPDGDINSIINWILTTGPVVVGIDWYQSMFKPASSGFISPTGGIAGGHAIIVRGVYATDPANTYFVLRNSWGKWGVTVRDDSAGFIVDAATPGGDALISKVDLVALLTAHGEAGALVDDVPAPPPPPPPPPPINPNAVLWQKVQACLMRAELEIKNILGVK